MHNHHTQSSRAVTDFRPSSTQCYSQALCTLHTHRPCACVKPMLTHHTQDLTHATLTPCMQHSPHAGPYAHRKHDHTHHTQDLAHATLALQQHHGQHIRGCASHTDDVCTKGVCWQLRQHPASKIHDELLICAGKRYKINCLYASGYTMNCLFAQRKD